MKLITEYTENNLSSMTEEVDGEKNVYIEGIFMQAEKKNRNGRIYERRVIIPAVERYVSEQVVTGRAVGELNHPEGPTVNLDKVSHRITNLQWEGNDCIGKALILNTPILLKFREEVFKSFHLNIAGSKIRCRCLLNFSLDFLNFLNQYSIVPTPISAFHDSVNKRIMC